MFDDVCLHPRFSIPISLYFYVFQGAGAATCAWLCWRTRPPYTSRTRAPPLSDITSASPTPSAPGPQPPLRSITSDLLLSSERQPLSRCSWARLQISFRSLHIYSVNRGDSKPKQTSDQSTWGSNHHYQPACKVPEACRENTYILLRTHTVLTYTLSWTVTHIHTLVTETESMQ